MAKKNGNGLAMRSGAVWNFLGSAMYGGNSLLMLVAVSRVSTVEQAGCFSIAFTTAQLLYFVGIFGVSHLQMTDYEERFSYSDYAKARALSVALAFALSFAAIFALGFQGEKAVYTVVLTALMMLNAVAELYQSLFFQRNRLDLSGSALFFRTFGSLAVFIAALLATRDVLLALGLQIAANLAILLYYRVRVAPGFLRAGQPSGGVRELIRQSAPLFVSLLLMNVITNFSKYGVEFQLDDAAQGYYSMIFMPAQVINLCSEFLFKPFLNRYAELLGKRDTCAFLRTLARQLGCLAALTGVCCAAAFLVGTQALGLLYGRTLTGLEVPLTLIVLGGGLFAFCGCLYYIFVILRMQKRIMAVYLLAFAVGPVPTALLTGRFGLTGAALSFILVNGVALGCFAALLLKTLRGKQNA